MADSPELARCVGDADAFLSGCWGQRPHLHTGGDFGDLLSLGHVDHIVSSMSLRLPAFRLVQGGRTLDPGGYTRSGRIGSREVHDLIDVGRVHRRFCAGATIVLQGLHRYWSPVAGFCRGLELSLNHPVQANAYVTPPGSSGLRVHEDAHDVFALQTHGRKQWVVYEPGADERAGPALDLTLDPGDCLYLPRGVRHAARTVDAASVHLTVGVRAASYRDVLSRAVIEALEHPALDERLPAGYAHKPATMHEALAERTRMLASRIAGIDPRSLAGTAARRFWTGRAPLLDGQLAQLLQLDRIDGQSTVRRRRGSVCALSTDGGRLRVALGDRELRMPVELEPVMRSVAARERFRVADLGDELDEASRVVLVRRLVREGLLVVG